MANTELENNIDLALQKARISNNYADTILGDTPLDENEGVNINLDVAKSAKFKVEGSTFVIDSKLPYVELEYIQSTGTQWINTGIHPSNLITMQIKFATANTNNWVVGTQINENYAFRLFGYSNKWYLDYGSGEGKNRIIGGSYSPNTVYNVEAGNRYIKNLDNNTNIISSTSVGEFNYPNMNIGIFASTDKSSSITSGTIYYLKIYDDNVLVRDFIPVKDENDVVCLYDKVTKQFFTNAGTGSFIAGPEI